MKLILSPAKSLDFNTPIPISSHSQPLFPDKANVIAKELSGYSKNELASLMKISDKLAELNYQRFQDFSLPFTIENSRPAVYAFSGDVYTGLDVYSLPKNKIERLQKTVRILSGLYGILRPLDLIQPYRLEMGTKISIKGENDLYRFWKQTITQTLNKELMPNELFLNLASVEYFKVIEVSQLKVPVVSPVFKDYKNGKLKIISFYAKKARGMMARFCVENNVQTVDELKAFDYGNYGYSEEFTSKENQPVFIR